MPPHRVGHFLPSPLARSEAVEEIALAAGGEIEHREPDRRAVGVTRLEPGFEGGVGADVGVDGADRNLFSHGGDCSLGIAGELLSVQDLGLGGSKCLLGAGDACRLGVDQALNFRERLGNDGIVGTQEIDLLQRLLLGGTRLLTLTAEVADVLSFCGHHEGDHDADDGGKGEPGSQRGHGEGTHGESARSARLAMSYPQVVAPGPLPFRRSPAVVD